MVGSRGFEPRSARSERAASANCATSRWWPWADSNRHWTGSRPVASARLGYMAMVPPGGLEPPLHGLRARRAALTLRGDWSEWRDSNPHLKAWKARRQPLPHIRSGSAYGYRTRPSTLATWNASSTPRPNMDRCRSPAHRHPSVVKDPALSSWWAARDSNPNAPLGENGFTARQRTIRTYRPFWRQRQDSNPDPRVLEARMLPLHHAAVVTISIVSKTAALPSDLARAFSSVEAKNKKGLLGDRPRRPDTR